MTHSPEASSRVAWPPILFGSATLIAVALTWLVPLPFALLHFGFIGGLITLAGLALIVLAGNQFRRAGTPIPPVKPTKAIVAEGVYQYSRNPMYLGLSLMMVGMAVITGSFWFVLAGAVAIIAVTKLSIEREEAYLERRFGTDYLDYKRRVRRWF